MRDTTAKGLDYKGVGCIVLGLLIPGALASFV